MAAIITRRKWRRQPQGPVSVDWSHPLSRSLAFLAMPGTSYRGTLATIEAIYPNTAPPHPNTANYSFQDTQAGLAAITTNPSSASGLAWAYQVWSGALSAYTLLWYGANIAEVRRAHGLMFGNEGAQQTAICVNTNGAAVATSGVAGFYEYNGSFYAGCTSNAGVVDGNYHVMHAVRNGTTSSIWSDGANVTATVTSSTSSTVAPAAQTQFGNYNSADRAPRFSILGAAFSRALEQGEIEAWSDNPYQILVPRTRRLYFGAASRNFSGTIASGSIVKTGKIPAVTIGYTFVPTVGSLVKTGQVPVKTEAFKFTPTTGSLVKTGQVPTLTKQLFFAPTTGSLVKSGQIPILTRKFEFTSLTGSLIKTGQPMRLYAPMTPTTGSIVKTGQVPILTISGGTGAVASKHSWFVKAIGVKTKIGVNSQVDSDTGDTP